MSTRDVEIGAAVASERGELSQQWLADKMRERGWKWAQATVWNVEKGERPLRLAEAEDIAQILGTELKRLTARPSELETVQHLEHGVNEMQRIRERFEGAVDRLEREQTSLAEVVRTFNKPVAEWPNGGLFWQATTLAKRAETMLHWTPETLVREIVEAKHGKHPEA